MSLQRKGVANWVPYTVKWLVQVFNNSQDDKAFKNDVTWEGVAGSLLIIPCLHTAAWLLQVFNNTPDETGFYRMTLEREGVAGSLLMIQPALLSFTFDGPPQPVLLDVASMRYGFLRPASPCNVRPVMWTADVTWFGWRPCEGVSMPQLLSKSQVGAVLCFNLV